MYRPSEFYGTVSAELRRDNLNSGAPLQGVPNIFQVSSAAPPFQMTMISLCQISIIGCSVGQPVVQLVSNDLLTLEPRIKQSALKRRVEK